jgi:hypothetical protein
MYDLSLAAASILSSVYLMRASLSLCFGSNDRTNLFLCLHLQQLGLWRRALGTFFALGRSAALEWLRGVWQMEHLERLCPQNLHLRSLLGTTTLEPFGLFGLVGLFESVGDMFVVLDFVESASD